ncbi:MAG: hypothetical protein OXI87_00695 [Albidovulum sp.]|nr:hypothetical protein [Albidovulum sp.]MDE0303391.1 hypothetical protein [Albidovulum sp.]
MESSFVSPPLIPWIFGESGGLLGSKRSRRRRIHALSCGKLSGSEANYPYPSMYSLPEEDQISPR